MMRRAVLVALLGFASTGWSANYLVGGNLGAAWFTAPSTDKKADGLRTSLLILGDGWADKGEWGIGLDVSSVLANRESTTLVGDADQELVALTSGVLMVGTTIRLQEFPAKFRLAAGGGIVHSWDDLIRGTDRYQQESWGPEFHVAGIWERELGKHGLVRIRLAGVNSSTVSAPIMGTSLRSSGNWSRVEFSMGWAWRS